MIACEAQQTYSIFEVDIKAELGEEGRFGPQGWCNRHVTILSISNVKGPTSTTPGPILRKLYGLPPVPPTD